MNRVILMGRLTRDPEVRYTQGERSMAVARYTLAVDRRGARKSQDGNEQTVPWLLRDTPLQWTAEDAVTRTETSRLPILLISWHLTEQVSLQRSIFVRGCVYWCPDASRLAVTPTKKVSVFIPQISSQMIRNLLIVKMRPLEENRHQKWESRSVMALCQYRMA